MSSGGQSSSRGLPRRPYGLLAMTSVSLSLASGMNRTLRTACGIFNLTLPDGSSTPPRAKEANPVIARSAPLSARGTRRRSPARLHREEIAWLTLAMT